MTPKDSEINLHLAKLVLCRPPDLYNECLVLLTPAGKLEAFHNLMRYLIVIVVHNLIVRREARLCWRKPCTQNIDCPEGR